MFMLLLSVYPTKGFCEVCMPVAGRWLLPLSKAAPNMAMGHIPASAIALLLLAVGLHALCHINTSVWGYIAPQVKRHGALGRKHCTSDWIRPHHSPLTVPACSRTWQPVTAMYAQELVLLMPKMSVVRIPATKAIFVLSQCRAAVHTWVELHEVESCIAEGHKHGSGPPQIVPATQPPPPATAVATHLQRCKKEEVPSVPQLCLQLSKDLKLA
jgi:hypothetical protein